MEDLLARRKVLKRNLTRLRKKVLEEASPEWDIDTVSLHEEHIDEIRKDFKLLYDEILAACPAEEEEDHECNFDDTNDRCDEVQIAVKRIIRELGGQPSQPTIRRQSREHVRTEINVKLPKLDIPKFSGDMLEWTSFSDLFKSSVHNHPSLKGAEKLQYLRTSLSGEAAELLDSYQISDANYIEAWKTLQRRYHNPRKLIQAQLIKFLDMSNCKNESGSELRKLADTASSVIRALKALNRPINEDCDLANHIITSRLDSETTKLWETKIGRDNNPTITELLEFIDDRASVLTSAEKGKIQIPVQMKFCANTNHKKSASVHQTTGTQVCSACKVEGHHIYACKEFNDASVSKRREMVKQLGLCFNCLRTGHNAQKCSSQSTCKKCKQKHHTLLHLEAEAKPETQTVSAHTSIHNGDFKRALLATALVTVCDPFGQKHPYRALIDPGADVSFASERCVQTLQIPKQKVDINLSGLGDSSVGISRGVVRLVLGSINDEDFQFNAEAYVLPKVTGILPKRSCKANEIAHLQSVPLADPSFNLPGNVDILLGADVFFHTFKGGIINVGDDRPVGLQTAFGWIVGGICQSQRVTSASVNHVRCDANLDAILERFWKLEEVPTKVIMTKEERRCEEHFASTTTRDENGRFIVELPFREEVPQLGASRDIAIRRLKQMERTLQRRPELKQQYVDFMREYEALGHMVLVPEQDLQKADNETCYLPHHPIIKESSSTTKCRVVYDASSKTSTGKSLNDVLITGPKLQDDLFVILIRFRMYVVAFTADICKMFRQIWVAAKHQDFQRIVWRESPSQPIRDYRLTTVTYGTSSAPYLSKRCLQQTAIDGSLNFPVASEVALRDYYMDDLMSGHFSVAAAIQLQTEMLALMDSSRMDLRKWSSNSVELLEKLDPKMREVQLPFRIDEDDVIKTLGLFWIPASDEFWFRVTVPPLRSNVTKRTISSDMAKVFDPLGFLGPVTISAKMILQNLWSLKSGWDDSVPESILELWNEYRKGLIELEAIKFGRCVRINPESPYELIGFSDASEKAIGASVYLRSKLITGDYQVSLVAAKTKVAPLKQICLPRLELNAALMLVKLMDVISDAFIIKPVAVHAFTDSTIVLSWLAKHPKKWHTYIANRVSQIQETIPFESWHHVSSQDNAADCASRGISSSELVNHALWWQGPAWLKQHDYVFPTSILQDVRALAEARTDVTVHHVTYDLSLINRFSSLSKLKRVTAYCFRFVNNCRAGRDNWNRAFLSSSELSAALMAWVRAVQGNSFASEIHNCIAKVHVSAKSKLRSLNPFVDSDGILRVGGRLRHAKIAGVRQNPILLPSKHAFTSLIIISEHLNLMHGGTQLVLSSIQRQFWIVNGRDAVSRQIKRCVICTRFRAQSASQMMSDLPSMRVNPNPCFTKVGVDFCGPFTLRISRSRSNRNYKGYIALFVCMTTRAVHIEVVTSLSTPDFIASLKRFIARRRLPSDIYSDCGRNFVGAYKEIRKLWNSVQFNADVGRFLAEKCINWHFNPPGSPHFGGIWEAGIKSVKHHLVRSLGSCVLTYEDLTTVTTQIEACLNSRPLTQLSSDPNDLTPLTPGHFLTGNALTALPEPDVTTEAMTHLSRWKLMQRTVQQFWKRWSFEYLSKLQQRPKWYSTRPNLQKGDLVVLKDERFPPMRWKLARIVEEHSGTDGLTRVCTINTADGNLKRPITKLCPLPIDPIN